MADVLRACLPRALRGEVMGNLTVWSRAMWNFVGIKQMGQIYPEISPLRLYNSLLEDWNTIRQAWLARGTERGEEMVELGTERADKMFVAIFAEQIGEHPDGTSFDGALLEDELRTRYGLDEESIALKEQIAGDFRAFLDEIETALIRDAERRFRRLDQVLVRAQRIAGIREDFEKLRKKPYFPLTRFGKWTLGVRNAGGELVEYEQFESERELLAAVGDAKRRFSPTHTIRQGMQSDLVQSLGGLPESLQKRLAESLELTEEQQKLLDDLLHRLAPGQSFRKQLIRRKGIKGFSHDGFRAYNHYFFHGSNHLGRILFKSRLQDQIDGLKRERDLQENVIDTRKFDGIRAYMEKHLDYIMNPKSEWVGLRSWAFMWYLGFMPKAAFVNFTQLPLVTYPYLAARYGDAATTREMARASKDAWTHVMKDKGLDASEREMIQTLINRNKIKQSFAMVMAGVAEGDMLTTFATKTPLGRRFRNFFQHGAYLFSLAEHGNRRVTAIAGFRLMKERVLAGRSEASLTPEEQTRVNRQALQGALEAIDWSHFEYSKFNRAPFMRGRKGSIFVFMQYVQNMMFFVARDPGRARFLAVMFLAAGLQGLPLAEDIMDLINTLFRPILKDRHFDVRQELREMFTELGANPDLLMMGGSQFSFGLSWLGSQVGIPIPEVDVSRSLSLGRVIPGFEAGTQLIQKGLDVPGRDFQDLLFEFETGVGGAALAMPMNILRAVMSDSPYLVKRLEMGAPSAVRSWSRAFRYAIEREEITPRGARLVEFMDPSQDVETTMLLMLQALGFSPRAVTKAQAIRAESKEVEIFYRARRTQLLGAVAFARQTRDREARKKALDAVTRYNRDVPYRELRIRRQDIQRSIAARERNIRREEQGVPIAGQRYIRAVESVRESHSS